MLTHVLCSPWLLQGLHIKAHVYHFVQLHPHALSVIKHVDAAEQSDITSCLSSS